MGSWSNADPLGIIPGRQDTPLDFFKNKNKEKPETASEIQARLAQELFEQTDPLRRALIGRSEYFLSGGNVLNSPQFANMKVQTGLNFNQAKDNSIARFAPGGALMDALTNLESDRASTLSAGAAGLQEDELSRALALGTGLVGTSLGNLGQAGGIQAMIAQTKAQKDAAEKGQLGDAAGTAASLYFGGGRK